jgi:hypothetical protein
MGQTELRHNGVLRSSLRARKRFRKKGERFEKAARPLKIHRGFIDLCENAGKRTQIRLLREEPPVRRGTNRQTSIEVAGALNR